MEMDSISELMRYRSEDDLKQLSYDRFFFPKLISFSNLKGKIEHSELLNIFTYSNEEIGLKALTKMILSGDMKGDNFEINFITKNEDSVDEFQFLIDKIKIYYQMSNNDIYTLRNIFKRIFNNKKMLFDLMLHFGVDRKYFKKYGFEIEDRFVKKDEGLGKWFK